MNKGTYHFQIGCEPELVAKALTLLDQDIQFGPHSTQRWSESFGCLPKPTIIPVDASWIEIGVSITPSAKMNVETVLFRFSCDSHTDIMMSVAVQTRFVCTAWRVPKWYGIGQGSPQNPKKYLKPGVMYGK